MKPSTSVPCYPFTFVSAMEQHGGVMVTLNEEFNSSRVNSTRPPMQRIYSFPVQPINWSLGDTIWINFDGTFAPKSEPIFERRKPRLTLAGRPIQEGTP